MTGEASAVRERLEKSDFAFVDRREMFHILNQVTNTIKSVLHVADGIDVRYLYAGMFEGLH